MYRIIGASLGLVALLSQPIEAQRANIQSGQETQQVQRDVEFLRLHRDMNLLEGKLQRNTTKVLDKDIGGRKVYRPGIGEILDTTLPPESIGDKVEKEFYNRLLKLSSRYGRDISPNAFIFTSGDSVIAADSNHGDGDFIFGENSLVLRTTRFSAERLRELRQAGIYYYGFNDYVYSVFYSYSRNGKIEAYQFPDVITGVIPIFRVGDFTELYEKIREVELGERKTLEQGYGINHEKVKFFITTNNNIASMLVKLILPDYPILDYPTSSKVMAKANRIIITGFSGSQLMGSQRIIIMSIGSSGDVKYWSSAYRNDRNLEVIGSPVHADLKIKLPISP